MGYLEHEVSAYSRSYSAMNYGVPDNIRQESSEQTPQPFVQESFCAGCEVQVETIAIELWDTAGRHHDTFRVAVLNNVQCQDKGIDKGWCQSVILGRRESQDVDIFLLLALFGSWIGAHDGASSRGDRDREESGHGVIR